jgi:hypothetical protein
VLGSGRRLGSGRLGHAIVSTPRPSRFARNLSRQIRETRRELEESTAGHALASSGPRDRLAALVDRSRR